MKYVVRNYPKWIGPYQIAKALSFGRCESLGPLNEPILQLSEKIYKWREGRRYSIEINKWDTWSIDGTLAPLLAALLKQFRKNLHGAPASMPAFSQTSNSAQGSFQFYEEGDEEAWQAGQKQWEEILDAMIWSFEQLAIDWENQYHTGNIEFLYEPRGDLVEILRGPNDTSHFDENGYQQHAEKIQKGLNLFGQYFTNLWD